jgi:hypothetical protein
VTHAATNSLDGGWLRGDAVSFPVGDIERERVPFVLTDAPQLVADLEGRVNNLGIPLLARALAEDRVELFVLDSFAVGPVARHCVDRIGHGDDPRQQRSFFAFQTGRVASSVPSFVMVADDGHHHIELLDSVENAATQLGMCLDMLEFGGGQRARFTEHIIIDADFSNVMQQTGQVDGVDFLGSATELSGQTNGEAGDAIAVTAGVRVFGVDCRRECPHDAAEELGLFVVERDIATVDAEDCGHAGHQAGFDCAEFRFSIG